MTDLDGVLYVAWQSRQTHAIHAVARIIMHSTAPCFEFAYIGGVVGAQREGFVPFTRMTNLDRVYRSDVLFPFLANRLMSKSRPDYAEYLERLALAAPVAPVALLARSQGRKPTDNLELFGPPCYDEASQRWEHLFFVRGVRHGADRESRAARLTVGQRLYLKPQPDNERDSRALEVLVAEAGGEIGFVPTTLLPDLDELRKLGSQMVVTVARVNPMPAPAHQRILVRLLVDHQPGYIPFDSMGYRPLAPGATQLTDLRVYVC